VVSFPLLFFFLLTSQVCDFKWRVYCVLLKYHIQMLPLDLGTEFCPFLLV
jgi:hypothetical protein